MRHGLDGRLEKKGQSAVIVIEALPIHKKQKQGDEKASLCLFLFFSPC